MPYRSRSDLMRLPNVMLVL
jgi:hypothetical protein